MSNVSNVTIMPGAMDQYEKTGRYNLRMKTYTARTVTECLLQAKEELGPDAIIVSRKTFKKGAFFGLWGGRTMVEMTFGTYLPPAMPQPSPSLRSQKPHHVPAPNPNLRYSGGEKTSDAESARIQELEAKLAKLTESVQGLSEVPAERPTIERRVAQRPLAAFVPTSLPASSQQTMSQPAGSPQPGRQAVAQPAPQPQEPAPVWSRRRKEPITAPIVAPEEGYPSLMQQLLEADIAAPLARQLISEVPVGLTSSDAATFLRTLLSQRLRISNGVDALPSHGKMRLLAFVGTTGVGKTTTIAKLSARYALMERRKVGIVTLDTQRIGAAEQLQKYGEILRVPVKVAHDKLELIQHLEAYAAEGKEIVMLDTAGRSPNEMIPLGETAHLFEGVGSVQKYLTVPAVLGQRDMENIVTKFQNIFTPDALILTKLDEASDHTCFGRLLTLQAKFGLPLAFVTTGQRVPDDIVLPDAHAIASRILASQLM